MTGIATANIILYTYVCGILLVCCAAAYAHSPAYVSAARHARLSQAAGRRVGVRAGLDLRALLRARGITWVCFSDRTQARPFEQLT